MSTSNSAAWLPALKTPLTVGPAEDWKPGKGEILIQNKAAAINPVDWKIQDTGLFVKAYPALLGADIAGVVVETGDDVTAFKKGDRVVAFAPSATGQPRHGGFQLRTIVPELVTAHIPSSVSFAQASVLPLAFCTAAVGLFPDDMFGLPIPGSGPTASASASGKTIVVWGGSSSVGTLVVQLARAAGAYVIATASKRNHAYVAELGADEVLDYTSPSVVDDLVAAVSKRGGADSLVGVYDAIGDEPTMRASIEVVRRTRHRPGDVGLVLVTNPHPPTTGVPEGVVIKPVFAGNVLAKDSALARTLFHTWIPTALADGTLKAKPDPLVVDHGLDSVQKAIDTCKAGVSAQKVVVSLDSTN